MNCRHVQDKLSEYIDGELPVAEQALVTAHLAQCGACRAESAALRRTASLARSWGAFAAPAELAYRLDPALIAARAEQLEPVSWRSRLRGFWIPAGGMATAALALALTWGLWHPAGPQRTAQAPAPGNTRVAMAGPSITPPLPLIVPGEVIDAGKGEVTPPEPAKTVAPISRPKAHARQRVEVAVRPRRQAIQETRPEPVEEAPRPARRARAPRHLPQPEPAEQPATPKITQVIATAKSLLSEGRYDHADRVLNAALERAWGRLSEEQRADYQQRNSDADTDIQVCTSALARDPGNAKAREFRDRAYGTKVTILASMAG